MNLSPGNRFITDELLEKPPTRTWSDAFFSIFLHFRLGNASRHPHHCLYFNYSSRQKGKLVGSVIALEAMQEPQGRAKRLCFISDTHERHNTVEVPKCDILVHTGDILFCGRKQSLSTQIEKMRKFDAWMKAQGPSSQRIVVGGNHDKILELLSDKQMKEVMPNCVVLHNQKLTIDGLQFYGSPYSRGRSKNRAFQQEFIKDQLVNDLRDTTDIDVLLTHSSSIQPDKINCRVKVWAWGHHHASWGAWWRADVKSPYLSVCASIMDPKYDPIQLPIVVDLEPSDKGPLALPATNSIPNPNSN